MVAMIFKQTPASVRCALLAAIVVLGAGLRCANIQQGLWWDEIWSTLEYATAQSWWHTISRLGYYFNNHPLYSIVCRFSIAVLGLSEISVRLPSVCMGVAALPVLYLLARPLTGTAPALLATLLMAFSSFHIDHSTEARGYAGMLLFALLSSMYFFKALSKSTKRIWLLFVLCTFLGFYCHPYMVQVPLAQLLCCVLLYVEQKLREGRTCLLPAKALKHLVLALAAVALLTLAAYAPMLKFFIVNAGKVQLLNVDRLPFVAEMYETILPGFSTLPGMLLYSSLTLCGLLYLHKRSPVLLIYSILICNLPLLVYLQLNPMFIFKRYFLPALPFSLLTLACGMVWTARACRLRGLARCVFFFSVLCVIAWLQWPSVRTITTRDRQHYREAAAFVREHAAASNVVFAIGHAGQHFNYYAAVPVIVPETFDDFQSQLQAAPEVWCLVSAWLPELRPEHEPALLYTEAPEHQKIYDFVKKNFRLEMQYSGAFRTYVYRWPADGVVQPLDSPGLGSRGAGDVNS